MSSEREVQTEFEVWLWQMACAASRLPDGFEFVDQDDPDLMLVTDGTDEFVIEVLVEAIKQRPPMSSDNPRLDAGQPEERAQ